VISCGLNAYRHQVKKIFKKKKVFLSHVTTIEVIVTRVIATLSHGRTVIVTPPSRERIVIVTLSHRHTGETNE
jgi:hypothetical protein